MTTKHIIHSSLTTPDGTILTSRHRHDYVTHKDANGKTYMLDGGHSYIRCSIHTDQVLNTLYEGDPHKLVRERIEWGTYGPNGDQPRHYVTLANMDTGHIEAVLGLLQPDHPYRRYYLTELTLRNNPKEDL